jgi:hypothetical protein
MNTQFLSWMRRAAVFLLVLCAADAWAIEVSPSPSYDGAYTVSWGTTLGCFQNDDPPVYSMYCYWLAEDGVTVATSGNSLPVSGKAPGSYQYYVCYTLFIYGQPDDEYVAEGPVTVDVLSR